MTSDVHSSLSLHLREPFYDLGKVATALAEEGPPIGWTWCELPGGCVELRQSDSPTPDDAQIWPTLERWQRYASGDLEGVR